MNTGRLIIILEQNITEKTNKNFHKLCRSLDGGNTPTFAIGISKDVTLALTSKWPQVIYNAYEFLSLDNPKSWQMVNFTEVYTILPSIENRY